MTDPTDRRQTGENAVLSLITEVHKDLKALNERLSSHMVEETHDLAAEVAKLMADAFPEGDPKGHRKYHEASIAKAEAKAEFWKKMLFEICRWGLIGFIGWMAVTLWKAFVLGPVK